MWSNKCSGILVLSILSGLKLFEVDGNLTGTQTYIFIDFELSIKRVSKVGCLWYESKFAGVLLFLKTITQAS